MTGEATTEIYTKLVHWVVDTAPKDWRRVEINMEMLINEQEVANSWITRCFVGDSEEKAEDYPATALEDIQMRDMFKELSEIAAETGDRWTVCNLVVLNDGKYTVDYQYDAPPRLSGDILAGSQ